MDSGANAISQCTAAKGTCPNMVDLFSHDDQVEQDQSDPCPPSARSTHVGGDVLDLGCALRVELYSCTARASTS